MDRWLLPESSLSISDDDSNNESEEEKSEDFATTFGLIKVTMAIFGYF